MKKLILPLIILLAAVGLSYAQPGGQGQRMSPEERDKRMIETLGLDEAQQAKYKAISEKYRKSFDEMRQGMQGASDEERRALFPKMREMNQARNKEVRAILNEEQAKKFDEMQQQREERMRERRPPGERGGDTRPGK